MNEYVILANKDKEGDFYKESVMSTSFEEAAQAYSRKHWETHRCWNEGQKFEFTIKFKDEVKKVDVIYIMKPVFIVAMG